MLATHDKERAVAEMVSTVVALTVFVGIIALVLVTLVG